MGVDTIIRGGVSGLIGGVADLIDRFIQTPEEKAKAIIELRQLEVREVEAIAAATSQAIAAEAGSGDPFVRRSRPTFLYLIYVILGWNFLALPLAQFLTNQPLQPINLPSDLYYLFGAGYLGYVGARTWDKTKGGSL